MSGRLRANLRANFLYYRRNRLLLAVVLVVTFFLGVSWIPALFAGSPNQRFALVVHLFESLQVYVYLLAVALGLLAVSSHLRDRSIKMVLTRPVPPALWLGSHWLSAALLLAALTAGSVALTAGALALWGIPWQAGFAYLGLITWLRCLVVFSFLIFLTTFLHPVLAGLVALVFQPATFYGLATWTASAAQTAETAAGRAGLGALSHLLYLLYTVLPLSGLAGGSEERISGSYRAGMADLRDIGVALVYTAVLAALFLALSSRELGRRRLV